MESDHQGIVAMERRALARAPPGIASLHSLNFPNSKLPKHMITGGCFLFPLKSAQTRAGGVQESTGSWQGGNLMSPIHLGVLRVYLHTGVVSVCCIHARHCSQVCGRAWATRMQSFCGWTCIPMKEGRQSLNSHVQFGKSKTLAISHALDVY